MILDDLINKLQEYKDKFGGQIPVSYVSPFTDHHCDREEYCHCMIEDHSFSVDSIRKETKYNSKIKKQEVVGLVFKGDKI